MRKSPKKFLSMLCLSLTSCFSTPHQQTTLPTFSTHISTPSQKPLPYLEEHIEYKKVSEIDFSSVPKEKLELPSHIKSLCYCPEYSIKSQKDLESIIQFSLQSQHQTIQSISSMSPKQLIELSRDSACFLLNYTNVDSDEFQKQHGSFLPLEYYLSIGKGDCNIYTYTMQETFKFLKSLSKNPQMQNIHLARNDRSLGSYPIDHCWNVLVIQFPEKLMISYLDATHFDSSKDQKDFELVIHWPDYRMYKALMLQYTNPQLSLQLLEKELLSTPQNPYLLHEKAFMQFLLRDKEGLKQTSLAAKNNNIKDYLAKSIDFYIKSLERDTKNQK